MQLEVIPNMRTIFPTNVIGFTTFLGFADLLQRYLIYIWRDDWSDFLPLG